MRLPGIVCSVMLLTSIACGQERGIQGRPAPELGVSTWINLPDGRESVEISDYAGKVVYLYFFQSWCPGCHSHGFPTMTSLMDHYEDEDEDDVVFVTVQTTFEGFETNSAEGAKRTAERYGLDIPVGHSGDRRQRSPVMRAYRTGGTPWTVIVDREGIVRFNAFHITRPEATRLIDRLLAVPAPSDGADVVTLPASRGGQDRIGEPIGELDFDCLLDARTGKAIDPDADEDNDAPSVTLIRWWTEGCKWCEASLPSVERLRREYESKGLNVIAAYHPKPPRARPNKDIVQAARRLRYNGVVGVDEDWSELRGAYLDTGSDRRATSVTILVDHEGVIRFVHPGPVFFSADQRTSRRENEDFDLLEDAIRTLLEDLPASSDDDSALPDGDDPQYPSR